VGTESHFEFTAEHFEVKRFVMAATVSLMHTTRATRAR